MSKSVLITKNYGKIILKLKDVMEDLGINRNSLAKSIDTRFEVIDKWYENNVEKLDLDILARICYVLDCKPADLLDYSISSN